MKEDVREIRPEPNQQEEIKAHALRYMGKIFTGAGHYDALEKLNEVFPGSHDFGTVEEGFITNTGRYVSRAEGYKINDEMMKRINKKIQGELEKLTVTCAVRYKGKIFTGGSHFNALLKLEKVFPYFNVKEVEDGFMISGGKFLNRLEWQRIENSEARSKYHFEEVD